jgi:hypothetical protein
MEPRKSLLTSLSDGDPQLPLTVEINLNLRQLRDSKVSLAEG